jgi:hypothetical protein
MLGSHSSAVCSTTTNDSCSDCSFAFFEGAGEEKEIG